MSDTRLPAASPALPAGTTDSHVHVFDPARFPYAPGRSYTPGAATVADLRRHHAGLGIERAVLVQPSVYGTDNACLLEALRQLGPEVARGVAVIDPAGIRAGEIDALHGAGVRGIRLNLEVRHQSDPAQALAELTRAGQAVSRPDWHLQLHCAAALLPAVGQALDRFAAPVVLDHFAGLRATDAERHAERLLALLATGRVHVKLSAFYRASAAAPEHADMAPLVQALVRARPDRLLWGSDWPHTGGGQDRDPTRIEPFRTVDLPASLAALHCWVADPAALAQILVANPSRLYGYAEGAAS